MSGSLSGLKRKLHERINFEVSRPKETSVLFTDASKYTWACVLTQLNEHEVDGKKIENVHHITCMSGLFHTSQISWAALTKEAM